MKQTTNPAEIIADAQKVLGVCKANTDFKLKDFTSESVEKDCSDLDKTVLLIATKEQEITPLRNQRDVLAARLKDFAVRGRSGLKGYFGSDSTQYEQAGGTRTSERKKPVRKPKTGTT